MYTSIGLGQAPKVGFPGAVAGRLRPWKSWRRIEQATMSYGYGLSASLFQLARAYTAIAHDGADHAGVDFPHAGRSAGARARKSSRRPPRVKCARCSKP